MILLIRYEVIQSAMDNEDIDLGLQGAQMISEMTLEIVSNAGERFLEGIEYGITKARENLKWIKSTDHEIEAIEGGSQCSVEREHPLRAEVVDYEYHLISSIMETGSMIVPPQKVLRELATKLDKFDKVKVSHCMYKIFVNESRHLQTQVRFVKVVDILSKLTTCEFLPLFIHSARRELSSLASNANLPIQLKQVLVTWTSSGLSVSNELDFVEPLDLINVKDLLS